MPGLGLLPVKTTLTADKVTRQVTFRFRDLPDECKGYEIHMGRTVATASPSALNVLCDGTSDGYFLNERCFGSYVHGLLDNKAVVDTILSRFEAVKSVQTVDYATYKEQQYDLLADHVRANLDMAKLYKILSCND
jgi:adenosylcobyric acid synthase